MSDDPNEIQRYWCPTRTDEEWEMENARRLRFHNLEAELFGAADEPEIFGNGDIRAIKLPYEEINLLVNTICRAADTAEMTATVYDRSASAPDPPEHIVTLAAGLSKEAKRLRRLADKLIESRIIWKD